MDLTAELAKKKLWIMDRVDSKKKLELFSYTKPARISN